MDSKLTFQQHFEGKISKANRLTGVLRRTFSHLDGPTLTWLYKALVRPHLEYCNAITYSRTITLMKAVEAVQRRATKQVAELRNIPYEERLQQLQLPSMQYRFRRGDMIELFKYTHQVYKVQASNISIGVANTITRGHPLKLIKPRCTTTLRLRTFPHRAIEDWNNLPATVVMSPSINCFKSRLDNHWKNQRYAYAQ